MSTPFAPGVNIPPPERMEPGGKLYRIRPASTERPVRNGRGFRSYTPQYQKRINRLIPEHYGEGTQARRRALTDLRSGRWTPFARDEGRRQPERFRLSGDKSFVMGIFNGSVNGQPAAIEFPLRAASLSPADRSLLAIHRNAVYSYMNGVPEAGNRVAALEGRAVYSDGYLYTLATDLNLIDEMARRSSGRDRPITNDFYYDAIAA